jgi:AP-3 complex subunit mu
MDIVEEVDAIVDASVISSDVSGSIQCQCRLSGIPDLLLTFKFSP